MKKNTALLFYIVLIITSCSRAQSGTHNNDSSISEQFTEDEGFALDALDSIQVSGHKLFSTFPNLSHDCNGSARTFTITRKQFNNALISLLNQHYTKLSEKERERLAKTASKAQREYQFTSCGVNDNDLLLKAFDDPPRSGTWIFQSLLDQRDLIIKW